MTGSLKRSPSTSLASSSTKKDKNKSAAPVFTQSKRVSESSSSQAYEPEGTDTLTSRPAKRQKLNNATAATIPLAERLRPKDVSEFVGQEHLTGPDSLLMHLLQGGKGSAGSMVLWGPSGCGKTTLARLLARRTDAVLKELSATSTGTNEVRSVFEDAKGLLALTGR